ncbi:ABC transporter permease [Paenibacillus glycanilyticus]|uniref:Permease n=1 Tax=Paenibacillus glycanilyticus TaxID=126569 RepID=A0ABQ6G4P5_9BACL|nr:ABC transporter permease [Paenibacillus glycanilyticus]GLX65914.1 permease [Paenibacillus glycanilyticus]
MTFRSLALSNMKGNWRSYSAFFLSCVFSVLIFYMYSSFIFHPDVVNGHIEQAAKVRRGMMFCLYIIGIFSFLFVLYSNSAFLKTRKQEFGLLSLFGMTKAQLRKLVIYESIALALLSIGVGIGLGMLFSKLFFMALSVFLKVSDPIPFAVPLKSLGITGIGFFVLFVAIAVLTSLRIGKVELVELFKAGRKPKGELLFSPWLVGLALVSLGSGYTMALLLDSYNFFYMAILILVTVTIGTYFLFTQFSVLLIRFLQKRHSVFYNRTNMVVLSQLGYKLKDNARILFMVSIMSAVILTASGTFYLMQVSAKKQIFQYYPYSIAVLEKGLQSHAVIDPDKMKATLRSEGFPVTDEKIVSVASVEAVKLTRSNGHNIDYSPGTMMISVSDYNRLAAAQGKKKLHLKPDTVAMPGSFNPPIERFQGTVNGKAFDYKVASVLSDSVMNQTDMNWMTVIMDDGNYKQMLAGVPENDQLVWYGYEVKDWENAGPALKKLDVSKDLVGQMDRHRADSFANMKETSSLTLFIGLFISLLFFIASGSLIYFKMFTELQEDQAQFNALKRIGMTKQEIRKITVTQIGIIFYLPCLIGTIHALFAMKALDGLMASSVWLYSLVIIGIFVVMQTIYFLLASMSYTKGLNRGTASA